MWGHAARHNCKIRIGNTVGSSNFRAAAKTTGHRDEQVRGIPADIRLSHKCEVQRGPLFGRYRGKADVANIAFCKCGGHTMRAALEVAGHSREAWRAAPGSARCTSSPAHYPRAMLLRQKSICDNQSHHARENQQYRKGFSDHWPRRMTSSQ